MSSSLRSSGLTQWSSVVGRTHWPLDASDTLPEVTTSNVASVLAARSRTRPIRFPGAVQRPRRKFRRRARRAATPAWLGWRRQTQELVCVGFWPGRPPLANQGAAGGWLRAVRWHSAQLIELVGQVAGRLGRQARPALGGDEDARSVFVDTKIVGWTRRRRPGFPRWRLSSSDSPAVASSRSHRLRSGSPMGPSWPRHSCRHIRACWLGQCCSGRCPRSPPMTLIGQVRHPS